LEVLLQVNKIAELTHQFLLYGVTYMPYFPLFILAGSQIYVVGGVSTETKRVLRSVEVYDVSSGEWDRSLPDLPIGAKSLACVVISADN
jgi:hypothetical protein